MEDPAVLDRMRSDWDARAREDANYYAAFGRRGQDDEEFLGTAAVVVDILEAELKRLPGRGAALEIGCGPGRLLRPMSRHFDAIHGVDVSEEMVRLARERLRDIPQAHAHTASGTDLARFPDASFDFVYSYAVFQHIPSRDVVFGYLEEAWRVLKPDGILRCQINGLPETAARYTTWNGVRIQACEVAEFARAHDFQLLALEGARTQYLWVTLRKKPAGWSRTFSWQPAAARLRDVNNAQTGEPAVPSAGPLAALALWIEGVPADADLNHMEVRVDGAPCALTYLGYPAADGVVQINAWLPAGVRTGLAPVEARWLGQPLCEGWMRLVPPGPSVPRLVSLTDGINLMAHRRTESGLFKAALVEVMNPEEFGATLDGLAVTEIDAFCTDPLWRRYEFNFRVPGNLAPGQHRLKISLGPRLLSDLSVEIG